MFQPHADAVWLRLPRLSPLERVHPAGLFEWRGTQPPAGALCAGRAARAGKCASCTTPTPSRRSLSGHDLYLFNEGRLRQAWRALGSHIEERSGVTGTRFAVWAPNAERVSVVGDFNRWDGRMHPMAVHGSSGVWELFIPGSARRRAVQV